MRIFATANNNSNAEIAQLVEHDLAKVGVASSSLVFRSKPLTKRFFFRPRFGQKFFYNARMVELVDTQDLKSCVHCGRAGSSPAPGTFFLQKSPAFSKCRAFLLFSNGYQITL
jgi:hypothetical protein